MGRVRMLPAPAGGVRLADAVQVYLGTISMANTRETYAAALDRLVADFGVDANVALMPSRSAKYSTSSSGTSNGSGRNMPRWRTVTICTAKPSRL